MKIFVQHVSALLPMTAAYFYHCASFSLHFCIVSVQAGNIGGLSGLNFYIQSNMVTLYRLIDDS